MLRVRQSHVRCRAGFSAADITPPTDIYHRMWGAATHDRATGVHRPLEASALWMAPDDGDATTRRADGLLLVSLDHCILDEVDIKEIQQAIADATGLKPEQALVSLTHTHGAGLMTRTRSDLPGGERIGPYLDSLAQTVARIAAEAIRNARAATVIAEQGRCNLAVNRDLFDEATSQWVVGNQPSGPADDSLWVARIEDTVTQAPIVALVHYACHPTTLAWDNTRISPDYPGALRETVAKQLGAPCMFLQGASGDLTPVVGYVGDSEVADRNGRQVGFAALSVLEAIRPGGTSLAYGGPVVSGTTIGPWRIVPETPQELAASRRWKVTRFQAPLAYRHDLPTVEDTEKQLAHWRQKEAAATQSGDDATRRDARAMAEQMTRQLWRLGSMPRGKTYPLEVVVAKLGEMTWVFVPGEHYQSLQTTLRERFPDQAVLVVTLVNGWQPGYIPPARTFGYGIYPEVIAATGPGAAETLIEEIARRIAAE